MRWLALAGPCLIFLGHALYGAMLPKTALALALAASLLLAGSLAIPQVRRELERVRGLRAPAVLFGLVLLMVIWSMTPVAPGGPHPIWAYLHIGPGASTIDKSLTLLELIKLVGLAAIFMLGIVTGASDQRARTALMVILALGAAFGLWAFLSFAGGALGPDARRLGASFQLPNIAATVFAMLLVIGFGATLARARRSGSGASLSGVAPLGGATLVFASCLLATASRGGFVAAAAGLVCLAGLQFFASRASPTRTSFAWAVALILLAGLLAVAGDQLLTRLTESTWDLSGRKTIFNVHWAAFRAAPLMGYGLGSFDTINRVLLDASNIDVLWSVRAAHNVYLSWLEQTGVLGALPMFACVATIMTMTVRAALKRTRMTTLVFALLAADVVVIAHGATDFALETYSIAAFWALLLGLQFSLAQGSSRR